MRSIQQKNQIMDNGRLKLGQDRKAFHRHLAGDILDVTVFHVRIEKETQGNQQYHEADHGERLAEDG